MTRRKSKKLLPSSRDKDVSSVLGRDGHAHDVSVVVGELLHLLVGVNVPKNASHVSGRSDDLRVVDESAARKIPSVVVQLTLHLDGSLLVRQIVYRADVVQTSASNHLSAGRVGAGHHPRRSEGDSEQLEGGHGVPNLREGMREGGERRVEEKESKREKDKQNNNRISPEAFHPEMRRPNSCQPDSSAWHRSSPDAP